MTQEQQAPLAIGETPEDLSAILKPNCPAMVWARQPLARFQNWIDTIAPEQLPKARVVLPAESVREAASRICDICGTPDCAERALLIDDTAALAHIFSELMEARYVLLQLDVVTPNARRKLDVDAVTARLVCTYRGTGTQCVVPTGGPEPGQVFTVPTGAPILFRGTSWPGHPRSGLLHRSPPIEGIGETRLVLVLDPVVDPDQHPNRELLH